jgi:hypothetical protein
MHGTIFKAEPAERRTLDRQALRLHRAWMAFVRYTRGEGLKEMAPLFERKAVGLIIRVLDQSIYSALSTTWDDCADEAAAHTAHRINAKIGKAAMVSSSFEPGDRDLMRRQKLAFISDLTLQQRNSTRAALTDGIKRGLGTEALARTFRDSIGLLPSQQQQLAAFERAQRAMRAEDMALPEADRPPISSDATIARLVDRQRTGFLQQRAEVIARTEALQVVGTASDIALRESLRDTGISTSKTFKTWNAHDDGRTRPEHAARDGVTIPLDDAFAPGIYKPGDGGPREAINCRCTLTYSFED